MFIFMVQKNPDRIDPGWFSTGYSNMINLFKERDCRALSHQIAQLP